MESANVSSMSLTLPLFPLGKPAPSPQDEKGAVVNVAVAPAKESTPAPVTNDTVSISIQTRQTIINADKEQARKEEVKKEAIIKTDSGEKSDKAIAKVDFVYDTKGDLIVKYMDSSNRLIYQAPSELMISLREAALKAESVDTKA